jgi:hypothetical protein
MRIPRDLAGSDLAKALGELVGQAVSPAKASEARR